jgi:hypothetical protein
MTNDVLNFLYSILTVLYSDCYVIKFMIISDKINNLFIFLLVYRFRNILSNNLCWSFKDIIYVVNCNIYNWDDLECFIYINLLKNKYYLNFIEILFNTQSRI